MGQLMQAIFIAFHGVRSATANDAVLKKCNGACILARVRIGDRSSLPRRSLPVRQGPVRLDCNSENRHKAQMHLKSQRELRSREPGFLC